MNEPKLIVTKIEPQKKRKNRFSVFVNDEFAFGLDRSVLLDNPIRSGAEITSEQIEHLLEEEEAARVKAAALNLLSYRMRSIKEMKDRLYKKKFPAVLIDSVVSELKRIGLLDDRKFSEAFIHSRMIQRPVSRSQLSRELKLKGVNETLIQETVRAEYDELREVVEARKLAEKRLSRLPDDRYKAKKRLSDFLMRRGFGWDIIKPLIDELIMSEEQE